MNICRCVDQTLSTCSSSINDIIETVNYESSSYNSKDLLEWQRSRIEEARRK